jgi:hypothetical protein
MIATGITSPSARVASASPVHRRTNFKYEWRKVSRPAALRWHTRTLGLIACLLTCGAVAQVRHADEDQVKAAYLFNFAKFVDWPAASFPGPNDPMVICSIGDERLAEVLQQTVRGKQAKGRLIEARQVSTVSQSKSCHILLIAFRDKELILPLLRGLQSASVLTVGQSGEFTRLGGMINLVRNDSSIELQINPKAAETAGLKISSRLLAISHIVGEQHGGGGL